MKTSLANEGLIFPKCSPTLIAAYTDRFGPTGRGFLSTKQTLLPLGAAKKTIEVSFRWRKVEIWVRFSHFPIRSINNSKFQENLKGVTQISNNVSMTRHEKLGFLTFSPENMEITMENLNEITEKFTFK